MTNWDIILVGGGLANCLIAKYFRSNHPSVSLLILESSGSLGGNHTWCWNDSDFALGGTPLWLKQLAERQWPGYTVHFPSYSREFATPYFGLRSRHLHKAISNIVPQESVRCETEVTEVYPHGVKLRSGEKLTARWVIDGRGQAPNDPCGYQKFVGHYVKLARPHNLKMPILMDARVQQIDGYRFMYALPWSDDTLLVEDTVYSNGPELNVAEIESRIAEYCQSHDWKVVQHLGSEMASLPIPLHHSTTALKPNAVMRSGLSGNLFHATTGYSLPFAARFAEFLGGLWPESQEIAHSRSRYYQQASQASQEFFRRLNNMLFLAAIPEQRWRIFDRFYRLNGESICRFYRGDLTVIDRMRLLTGRPPVPILSGIVHFFTPAAHAGKLTSSPTAWPNKEPAARW